MSSGGEVIGRPKRAWLATEAWLPSFGFLMGAGVFLIRGFTAGKGGNFFVAALCLLVAAVFLVGEAGARIAVSNDHIELRRPPRPRKVVRAHEIERITMETNKYWWSVHVRNGRALRVKLFTLRNPDEVKGALRTLAQQAGVPIEEGASFREPS
jgi:hypothetical protein